MSDDDGTPLPLAGVRILDMTNVLAGPFASYQLGLLGAEIIKIEAPGAGNLARQLGADADRNARQMGSSFVAQNAGKRSITLNLKSDAGRDVFTKLVRGADALIENFRPGVLARLGFSDSVLHSIHPALIYCAVSGFGATGPLKDRPAYDQIIQGLSGMMYATGTAESGPLRAGYPIADTLGGMAAGLAVSAALFERQRSGRGATIDVSMLETAMTSMGWVVSNYLVANQDPIPMGNENFTASPSGTFHTGDGLLNISANRQTQFETLCRVIGAESLIADVRFSDRESRLLHREELHGLIEAALSAQSSAEWEETLSRVGVPAGRVLTVPDALAHEQVTYRNLVHDVPDCSSNDEHNATVSVLGNGIQMNGRTSIPSSGPPALGQHTDEILSEIGFDSAQIQQLRVEGAI